MSEQEQNKIIAEWVGFELRKVQCIGLVYYEQEQDCWYYKGREYGLNIPDFPRSLDECEKWVVPKLPSEGILAIEIVLAEKEGDPVDVHLLRLEDNALTSPYHGQSIATAAALCIAVVKLLKGEGR